MPTRHRAAAALAAISLVVLVACGDDDGATPTATAPATTTTDGSSGAATTRTVQGADGPAEIPVDPQRIVGDLMALDYLSALGVDTAHFVGVFGAEFFEPDHYLADVLQRADLVDPGFVFEANLEALAAAEPDLIIAPFDQIDGAPGSTRCVRSPGC